VSLPNLLLSSGANGSPWWISAIEAFIIINLVLVCFAYLTLAERKVMGRMQLRYGPNRAGPYGLLQPIADLVKLIRKESFFPAAAIDVLYIFAPFLAAFTALCTFSVIPFGPGWEVAGYQINGYVADLPIALLLIFAIGSLGIYGFILGGWASDSKFALLGSMRTAACSSLPDPTWEASRPTCARQPSSRCLRTSAATCPRTRRSWDCSIAF